MFSAPAGSMRAAALDLLRFTGWSWYSGYMASHALIAYGPWQSFRDALKFAPSQELLNTKFTALAGGLVIACIAVMARTMTRPAPLLAAAGFRPRKRTDNSSARDLDAS